MKIFGEAAMTKLITLIKSGLSKKQDSITATGILERTEDGTISGAEKLDVTLTDLPTGILKSDGETITAATAGTDYVAGSDLSDMNSKFANYLPLSGGTLTGNLTGKYIIGTCLQTTAATDLAKTPPKVAVLDDSGWVYYRTPAEILSDIGAAPGGYGLGGNAIIMSPDDAYSLDNIHGTGWYIGVPVSAGFRFGFMPVEHIEYSYNYAIQKAYLLGATTGLGNNIALIRTKEKTAWGEWEWVNPPMNVGVEYRTTERYQGKAVYKKLDTDGIIYWRIDGETKWTAEAECGGAMCYTQAASDCNTVVTPGNYRCTEGVANAPSEVGSFAGNILFVLAWDKNTVSQLFFCPALNAMYSRNSNVGNASIWSDWQRLATASDLDTKVKADWYSGDLNTLTADGHYRLGGDITNGPTEASSGGDWGNVIVARGINTDSCLQILVDMAGNTFSRRIIFDAAGTPGAWQKLNNACQYSTADITAGVTAHVTGMQYLVYE